MRLTDLAATAQPHSELRFFTLGRYLGIMAKQLSDAAKPAKPRSWGQSTESLGGNALFVSADKAFDRESFAQEFMAGREVTRHRINGHLEKFLTREQSFSAVFQMMQDDLNEFRRNYETYLTEARSNADDQSDEKAVSFIKLSLRSAQTLWYSEWEFIRYLRDRLDEKKSSLTPPSAVERTERLAAYAKEHGDNGLDDYARLLFPEWFDRETAQSQGTDINRASLPTEAPETYQGLRGPETPPAFVQRVYGEWLGHGLTKAHIRNLDPALYTAIHNWLKKPGCEWPSDVDLPTLKEQNDRDIARLNAGEGQEILGKFTGKEAARIGAAIHRRGG